MLDSHEFQDASKEEQQMLADFKPQRSISLERGHPERRKTLDDNFKDQSKKPLDPEESESTGTVSWDEREMPQNKKGEHSPQNVAKLTSDHNNIVDDPTVKETGIGNAQILSEIPRKNLEGWRRTGNRGLISPDGTKFRTKRQAVEQLAKRGGCELQVEALRDLCVEEDGWTREMLPKGWLGKERDKVLFFVFGRNIIFFLKTIIFELLVHYFFYDSDLITTFLSSVLQLHSCGWIHANKQTDGSQVNLVLYYAIVIHHGIANMFFMSS